MKGEASGLTKKSATGAQMANEDASTRLECYTRAKEILWMEDKKDSRLALALKKSDELYNEYNQRLHIHTSRAPKAALVPDAFTNKEFWSHESCILQERLSEMASHDGFPSDETRHDDMSMHFPQYMELDRLCEVNDDLQMLPTFYRYYQGKRVHSSRKKVDCNNSNGNNDASTLQESRFEEPENVGIRHFHSRYYYSHELLPPDYDSSSALRKGENFIVSLDENILEDHKNSRRFELRVDDITRHEIARVADELHEEIHAEHVTIDDSQRTISRRKHLYKRKTQTHKRPLKFLGILKAVTSDYKPHVRPLLCDTDIEIAMNEMLDTSIFKYAYIQTPTDVNYPLFRDTSCYFRLNYDYVKGISWYVVSLKVGYLEMCSLGGHESLLPLFKCCLCPSLFPDMFDVVLVKDDRTLDKQLVNAGMAILEKARKVERGGRTTILRFFEVYFDRVYEEKEDPIVNDKFLKVTYHPNESVVMTIPTYRLYQIGRTKYVDSYTSLRRNAVSNLTDITIHRLKQYYVQDMRQKEAKQGLLEGINDEIAEGDDDDQDDITIINKLKRMDVGEIIDKCNGCFFENAIEDGSIKVRQLPEDTSTLPSPVKFDQEEIKYYDDRHYKKAEKLVGKYKELKVLEEQEKKEESMGSDGLQNGYDSSDSTSIELCTNSENDYEVDDSFKDDLPQSDIDEWIERENDTKNQESKYGSMLKAFRRGILEGKHAGEIYCDYLLGTISGENDEGRKNTLSDNTQEHSRIEEGTDAYIRIPSTFLSRRQYGSIDDDDGLVEGAHSHLTIDKYLASTQAIAAEKKAKMNERRFYIQDSSSSIPNVLLSFLDEWRAHLDKLESMDNIYPPDADNCTHQLWSDRMCIEALYDFATHLSMEDMFNNREHWHDAAKSIQRQFKGEKGKTKSDRTPYDIQQCGRDNIEEFLKHVNPALAILIREKILIEWRRRHGRIRSRRKHSHRRKRDSHRDARVKEEGKEGKEGKRETRKFKEEASIDETDLSVQKAYSIVNNVDNARTYEFAGWVRRLSTVITKALEFRFSQTKRKKRNAIIKTTRRTVLALKNGSLDASFTLDTLPEDSVDENTNDSDDEVSVYEEAVVPIAPRGSLWGTQDPVQCIVRTKSKTSKKRLNVDVNNNDNMSDLTNSPQSIAFSIPSMAISPAAIDEDSTESEDEEQSYDTVNTCMMDHVVTQKLICEFVEKFCGHFISTAFERVVEQKILRNRHKSASAYVKNSDSCIPETDDNDHHYHHYYHHHCSNFTDPSSTSGTVRVPSALSHDETTTSRHDSHSNIKMEEYWLEYMEDPLKKQSKPPETIQFQDINCNTVLDLPMKPMIIKQGSRLHASTIYDSSINHQPRTSPKDEISVSRRQKKTTMERKSTINMAIKTSNKSASNSISTDEMQNVRIDLLPEILITPKQRSSEHLGVIKKTPSCKASCVMTNQDESRSDKNSVSTKSTRLSSSKYSSQFHRFTFTDVGTGNWCAKWAEVPHEPTTLRPTQPSSPVRNSTLTFKNSSHETMKIHGKNTRNDLCNQLEEPTQQRISRIEKTTLCKRKSDYGDNKAQKNQSGNEKEFTTRSHQHLDDGEKMSPTTVEDILVKFNIGQQVGCSEATTTTTTTTTSYKESRNL